MRRRSRKYLGVSPERVVDVMALRGDTIDNIPGAPGIGDKGSVELIKRFGRWNRHWSARRKWREKLIANLCRIIAKRF